MAAVATRAQVESRDKNVQWYISELKELEQPAREVFEKYSGIPSEKVVPHILEVRERAWQIWPYPCIGRFRFLDLSISRSPRYPEVLKRMKEEDNVLLDLGCCFAQDIRKLVADGAPAEHIWGAELRTDFIELGYDLFLDKGKLKANFINADVFDPESQLSQLNGKVDIVYTGSFFHLFDWDQQVIIAKQLVRTTKAKKGSLVLGRQVGDKNPGTFNHGTNTGGKMYRHDPETWTRLWNEVGEQTGSEWKVEATLDERVVGNTDCSTWNGNDAKLLRFTVERLK